MDVSGAFCGNGVHHCVCDGAGLQTTTQTQRCSSESEDPEGESQSGQHGGH